MILILKIYQIAGLVACLANVRNNKRYNGLPFRDRSRWLHRTCRQCNIEVGDLFLVHCAWACRRRLTPSRFGEDHLAIARGRQDNPLHQQIPMVLNRLDTDPVLALGKTLRPILASGESKTKNYDYH